MKVREEIDALKTMGLDPVRFLIVPRVIAAVCMTPLLTIPDRRSSTPERPSPTQ